MHTPQEHGSASLLRVDLCILEREAGSKSLLTNLNVAAAETKMIIKMIANNNREGHS